MWFVAVARRRGRFDIVIIDVCAMVPKTAAHLLKHDTVLGKWPAGVSFTDSEMPIDGRAFKFGRIGRSPSSSAESEGTSSSPS